MMRMRYPSFPWVRFQAEPQIKDFLMKSGTLRKYSKGEVVIPSRYMYPYLSLIAGGMLAKGFDVHNTSKIFSHSILLPGSTVGDYYFMTGNVCNLQIIAMRPTTLIEVPHEAVYARMKGDMEFSRKIMNHLMMDIGSDSEGLATVSSRPADERLKILLRILIIRYQVRPENGWYRIPVHLTHEEYSKIIYATPLTVNRFFIKFRKEGLMKKEGDGKFIHGSLLEGIPDWFEEDPLIRLPV